MKGAAESPNYQTSNIRERYIEVVVGGGGIKNVIYEGVEDLPLLQDKYKFLAHHSIFF